MAVTTTATPALLVGQVSVSADGVNGGGTGGQSDAFVVSPTPVIGQTVTVSERGTETDTISADG